MADKGEVPPAKKVGSREAFAPFLRLGKSLRAQLPSFGTPLRAQLPSFAGTLNRLGAASFVSARAASARIAQAGQTAAQSAAQSAQSVAAAAKTLPGRVVPDVRAQWIRLRNRTVFGVLAVVFVYAAGSATPAAIAHYQLEKGRRETGEGRREKGASARHGDVDGRDRG